MFLFVLKQQNKTCFLKQEFFRAVIVNFYPAVPNFNRNKHIKPVVNRYTVVGTFNIHFI